MPFDSGANFTAVHVNRNITVDADVEGVPQAGSEYLQLGAIRADAGDAAAAGHHQVECHDVYLLVLQQGEGLLAGFGGHRPIAWLEHQANRLARPELVIDDQNQCRSGWSFNLQRQSPYGSLSIPRAARPGRPFRTT